MSDDVESCPPKGKDAADAAKGKNEMMNDAGTKTVSAESKTGTEIIGTGTATVGGEAVVYILSENTVARCYGIAVSKLGADGTATETAYFSDVTVDRNEAERIFDLVRRGTVTPCVLGEVIEDLICG